MAFFLQFGLSLKDSIDHWNKFTNRWLRFVVYDRTTRARTLLTYVLSAVSDLPDVLSKGKHERTQSLWTGVARLLPGLLPDVFGRRAVHAGVAGRAARRPAALPRTAAAETGLRPGHLRHDARRHGLPQFPVRPARTGAVAAPLHVRGTPLAEFHIFSRAEDLDSIVFHVRTVILVLLEAIFLFKCDSIF